MARSLQPLALCILALPLFTAEALGQPERNRHLGFATTSHPKYAKLRASWAADRDAARKRFAAKIATELKDLDTELARMADALAARRKKLDEFPPTRTLKEAREKQQLKKEVEAEQKEIDRLAKYRSSVARTPPPEESITDIRKGYFGRPRCAITIRHVLQGNLTIATVSDGSAIRRVWLQIDTATLVDAGIAVCPPVTLMRNLDDFFIHAIGAETMLGETLMRIELVFDDGEPKKK